MTNFPRSPRVMKGAIIGLDLFNPLASVIIFQYNPHRLTRRLEAQMAESDSGEAYSPPEALRFSGPPTEDITVDVELDAADQLETGDSIATSMGIYPQLSALEMLIYPKSAVVIANTILAAVGTLELISPEAPLTLFVWGPKRVLPVRLTSFSITEEAYDVDLNPIRATVNLGLRVLTYKDFSVTNVGYHLFLAHQVVKEVMATTGSVGNIASFVEGL